MNEATPWETEASVGSAVPGIVTNRLLPTGEFYRQLFGFRAISGDGDTMVLEREDGARLALLRAGNSDQPAALQSATRGHGWWLALEVANVEAVFARAHEERAEIVSPLEITNAAARRFIVRDPNGVLVVVTESNTATSLISSTTSQLVHQP